MKENWKKWRNKKGEKEDEGEDETENNKNEYETEVEDEKEHGHIGSNQMNQNVEPKTFF